MKKRIYTGLIMLAILLPVAIFSQLLYVFDGLILLVILCASFELMNMYDKESKLHPVVKAINILLTFGLYFGLINSGFFTSYVSDTLVMKALRFLKLNTIVNPTNAVFAIFILIMSMMVMIPSFTVKDAGKLLVSIIYIAVGTAAITILRHLGTRFLVYLLVVTVFTDIFALVFGMLFGKHKMAPAISPKKTWEGAIGGTATAVIVGFALLFLYKFFSKYFHGGVEMYFFDGVFDYASFTLPGMVFFNLTLTFMLSVCGQIGDLVASKLKRNYGIKDYSNIFPGHGGILDRFDSAIFAATIFVVFLVAETNIFSIING